MSFTPFLRRWPAGFAATVMTGVLVALAGPALAQPPLAAAPPLNRTAVTHPAADHLGSTVRAHLPAAQVLAQRRLAAPAQANQADGQPYGMDVSSFQGNVDWSTVAAGGAKFVYVKASEDTGYLNPYFDQQYNGAYTAGLIRGAYHFALPNNSSGATQADYFLAHGGGWAADGRTLPPMLDIEYNPYGQVCYNMTPGQMSYWIREFSTTVHARTGRYPTIYSTTDWWNLCTGSDASFAATNPLFLANYSTSVGAMPAGWAHQMIWQYSDHGTYPGDADVFNGSLAALRKFAAASSPPAADPIADRYAQLGGTSSYLGGPVGGEYPIPGGAGQNYQTGRMYYTPATGARVVRGAIVDDYLALGGPSGLVGTPVTDELATPDGAGRFNHFTGSGGASIYWTPTSGAHQVQGLIRRRWAALGWERGRLGYPTRSEYQVPGGRRSTFQHGSISWTAATGALDVSYR